MDGIEPQITLTCYILVVLKGMEVSFKISETCYQEMIVVTFRPYS